MPLFYWRSPIWQTMQTSGCMVSVARVVLCPTLVLTFADVRCRRNHPQRWVSLMHWACGRAACRGFEPSFCASLVWSRQAAPAVFQNSRLWIVAAFVSQQGWLASRRITGTRHRLGPRLAPHAQPNWGQMDWLKPGGGGPVGMLS